MVIYPNRHNLWFGSSIYCRSSSKTKFFKATCNHPPFNNSNSIDSKCHIFFHTSTSFQFQEPWHHLGDFLTYSNEIIQFAKDHPCNQRSDFESHHCTCPCIMASFITWLDIKPWTLDYLTLSKVSFIGQNLHTV